MNSFVLTLKDNWLWLPFNRFEVQLKGNDIYNLKKISSHGGLEVEQWSDNRTFSISVDQSPLGVRMNITHNM